MTIITTADLEMLCHILLSQVPQSTNATKACITPTGTESLVQSDPGKGLKAGWENVGRLQGAKQTAESLLRD